MFEIELVNVSIGYEKPLIENINLSAKKGEVIAVVGFNGSGKSTLLKTISRIIPAFNGHIFIQGIDALTFSNESFYKKVGFSSIAQINASNLTVYDLVSLGRIPHTNLIGKLSENDKMIIDKALVNTGIETLKNKNINKISDGQKQRAFIARLLVQQTDILFFDEPTAFLDIEGKYKIVSLFRIIAKKLNKIIVFSTHDLKIAIQNTDKIWLFKENKIIENSPEDLIISGEFNKIFTDKSIIFDNFTADFYVNNCNLGSIKITDKSESRIKLLWTKNALNRVGYSFDNQSDIEIVVNPDNWTINFKNECLKFQSIYKLLNFLQNEIKN